MPVPDTAFLADAIALEHDTGAEHPECPARFYAALEGLSGFSRTETIPRAATEDELAACHTRDYLRTVKREILGGASELSTGDTQVSPRSLDAALRASGLVLNAVDLVAQSKARNAFCVVRPPGHHATADRGMGFCIFNNIAVAARYAQREHGAARILVADWDVHHGNGTQDIFYSDGSVLFFSTHQHPWYPGTGMPDECGDGRGEGLTINRPFPAGTAGRAILDAFRSTLEPAAASFRPEMIFISAGFDSRRDDPLGRFLLRDEDFAELTRFLMELADRYCGGRLVSVLEGGYNLAGLTEAVRAHAGALVS
jgi:acetoin utilization deacetylase AcuC-like enzyme